ncbi:hypothetical protein WMY93_021408 [Mugilogobius chulae]|uniref:Uncharacterized protein n=1 Tax=Mugilogobius chulae TaxID=88201 RepID=A0AAW0NHR6_9GOBI
MRAGRWASVVEDSNMMPNYFEPGFAVSVAFYAGLPVERRIWTDNPNPDILTWPTQADLSVPVPDLPREVVGGKSEAERHFLFRRKQEKAGRVRFWSLHPRNNKNLTLTGNGPASKRPDRFW